jgi:GLPGLI family protein
MNKKIICLLLFVFPLLVRAQEISIGGGSWANEPAKLGKNKTLDTSVMECIYNYRIIDHSIGDMREYYAILEIGDTVSKFESYGSYRLDSVLVGKQQMTNGEFLKTYNMYRPDFKEFLLENANTKRLSYYGKVSIDSYTYQEDIPQIDWVLSDSTKMICGYLCHQATAVFRGRNWIAWFCDIPKSVGPWKLNGLPGLILEAQSEDKEHTFTAISVRKSSSPIIVRDTEYFKTTREHFNKAVADYKSDPTKSWKNSPLAPKDMNGKTMPIPKRKLFYNPLEKE